MKICVISTSVLPQAVAESAGRSNNLFLKRRFSFAAFVMVRFIATRCLLV